MNLDPREAVINAHIDISGGGGGVQDSCEVTTTSDLENMKIYPT